MSFLLNREIISQYVDTTNAKNQGQINFSDILEVLSEKQEFQKYFARNGENGWIVKCGVDITEYQNDELWINEIIFTNIIFEASVFFFFQTELRLSLEKVDFLLDFRVQGITRKSILEIKSIQGFRNAHGIRIVNCQINEFIFNKPNILYLEIAFERCIFNTQLHLKEKAFQHRISFCFCKFLQLVSLQSSSFFEKTLFYKTVFKDNVYFDYANFHKTILFYEVIFEKNTSFYHTMCFSPLLLVSSNFKESVNFLELRSMDAFERLQTKINDLDFDFIKSDLFERMSFWDKRSFCRDTFRLIKNTFAKEGNILDASVYNKAELYCREMELNFAKPLRFSRSWIDKWQLWFYRLTSDHHTDLVKIFNNVIMLIALFGIFAFGLDSLATHNFSTPKPPQKFIFGMLSKTPNSVAFWSLGLLLGAGILTEIRNIAKTYLKGIFLSFLWRSIPSIVLLLILCVLMCESFALLPLWLQETILIFGVCFSFVGIYLFLLWRESRVWIAISHIVNLGILLFKPSLLLPFVGQLFDEGLKTNFPAMQSLSVVYCILMFLMLFSLQKTARKNSIIPS